MTKTTKTPASRAVLRAVLCSLFLVAASRSLRADPTWIFAVQIGATVQVSPPQITLSWEPDQYGANSYTIYRKAKDANSWGAPLTTLSGSAGSFTDTSVVVGSTYEYGIVKVVVVTTPNYTGYGYIYTGVNAALTENRGKLLLVVATNSTASLATELARLQTDLIGDGWQVIRHDVSSNDTPAAVRTIITNDYYADPANVNALFLFGHVPILQSGNLNYDTHGARPLPADAYYGDVNNDWPTNVASSPSYLPSDVKLMIGRVDMFDMPGIGAPSAWPNETELLRNYLNKDHNWRFKLITVQRRALIADRFGVMNAQSAATGWRNFEPFVGPGNINQADISDNALVSNRWISLVTAPSYLWSYGCGGGYDTGISELGTHGQYNDAWSTDIVGQDAKAVFTMFNGSHFGAWDHTDNLLRSVLATPTTGLTACLAGQPHWFCHHMGLGEPIGYSTRLTMNNSNLYQNYSNVFTRAIYISLMGDPSLRMEPVGVPSALTAVAGSGSVTLKWSPSTDTIAGYHVYRATTATGPFSRLTGSLITGTNYTDSGVSAGTFTYMVRAVALQTNPSGSYFNPSQGIFVTANVTGAAPPMTIVARRTNNNLLLTWNSSTGFNYRVQAKTNLTQTNWTDLSGGIPGLNGNTSWTDTNITVRPRRFYRVVSP